ncbi:MAG: hypothetical protein ABSF23_12140 [Terracidiphilus sp.]|jgi:hypothetical protein
MLRLLLDEHISPAVAAGLRRRAPSLAVCGLVDWEGGAFLGQDDAACLSYTACTAGQIADISDRAHP